MSYEELLMAYSGNLIEDEVIGPYIEKYKKPTLDYYEKNEQEFQRDLEAACR